MRESGPQPEVTAAPRTPAESRARLKRLGLIFASVMAGAAAEQGRATIMSEPTVDVKAEAAKAAAVASEKATAEKTKIEDLTAEWGFNPREIHVTSEDLLRLPTITNWDTLNVLDDQETAEFDRLSNLSDDPEFWTSPELERLRKEFLLELGNNWTGFDSFISSEKDVAVSSLINSYAVDTEVERQQLADAVSKTEIRIEDDRITAVYHPNPGEDITIHEWLPDQSPLEVGVVPMQTSLNDRQHNEKYGGGRVYQPSGSYQLSRLISSEPRQKSEWIQQVIVNGIQQELLYADLSGVEENNDRGKSNP